MPQSLRNFKWRITLVLSWSSQFTEIMWAHGGDESLWWSLHWEATKKTDTSKGDYYFIICSPVLFLLFFFLLLFCFDCLFLLLLLLLVLLFIYSIFCLVSLTVIFSIYRFFHYVFNADVNECEQYNKGGCSHDCINTAGSFYCKCPTGFQLNKKGICEGNTINTNVFE